VFALEVIMLEYSVSSFIPVILAAVSATAVSNAVFGDHPAFTLPALFAGLADYLPLTPVNQVGLFALLGMGAMMSGSLQAPLAALVAMLELTDNPDIILPGMLVVVISGLTASEIFGKESIFHAAAQADGLQINKDPPS